MRPPGFTQTQFDYALAAMIQSVSESGGARCRVVARDLHRAVVGASQPNRMPMACNAMWKLAEDLPHTVVHRTPSGRSSSLEIEYHLDGETITAAPPSSSRRVSQPRLGPTSTPRSPTSQGVVAPGRRRDAELPDADLYLVACVKRKASATMPARELYTSSWFQRARACVERTGQPWAVLSAKHGLLWPTDTVAPYEMTLRSMSGLERRQWADTVLASLAPHLAGVRTITILAGTTYRKLLVPELERRDIEVLVPMEGLSQGRQLQWLDICLTRARADERTSRSRVPQPASERLDHLRRFYDCLADLEMRLGGTRKLSECSSHLSWPARGVYFFMEPGETRFYSGSGLRVVRVGTHGLKPGARSTLWKRLVQHRGTTAGGGNHRTSIFRLLVGAALIARDRFDCPSWNNTGSAHQWKEAWESPVEHAVSAVIGSMPFLWLDVPDEPGHDSLRGYIERNAIALLSNRCLRPLDPQSDGWLGRYCDREKVRTSGLWNSNHVDKEYDPDFLQAMERLAGQVTA